MCLRRPTSRIGGDLRLRLGVNGGQRNRRRWLGLPYDNDQAPPRLGRPVCDAWVNVNKSSSDLLLAKDSSSLIIVTLEEFSSG